MANDFEAGGSGQPDPPIERPTRDRRVPTRYSPSPFHRGRDRAPKRYWTFGCMTFYVFSYIFHFYNVIRHISPPPSLLGKKNLEVYDPQLISHLVDNKLLIVHFRYFVFI